MRTDRIRRGTISLCMLLLPALILCCVGDVNAGGGGLPYGLVGLLNSLGVTDQGTRPPLSSPPRIRGTCPELEGLGPVDLPVILGNRTSNLEVNLVTEGEPLGPSNLYRPGETRSVTVFLSDDHVTFHAVHDGNTIATQTWSRDPGQPCSVPVVLFESSAGSATLTIVTGKRSY